MPWFFTNNDMFPKLPTEITRENLICWGEKMVNRSQGFADRNRFATVYIRPFVAFITALTGAAGVATTITEHRYIFGLAVVILSSAAAALNALFARSSPEVLYVNDRFQQVALWQHLNHFKLKSDIYAGKSDDEACRFFAQEMTRLTYAQIAEWASRGRSATERTKEPAEPPNSN